MLLALLIASSFLAVQSVTQGISWILDRDAERDMKEISRLLDKVHTTLLKVRI